MLQALLQQDFPDVKLMLRKQTDIEKAFITRLVCVQQQPRGQAKIGNGTLNSLSPETGMTLCGLIVRGRSTFILQDQGQEK